MMLRLWMPFLWSDAGSAKSTVKPMVNTTVSSGECIAQTILIFSVKQENGKKVLTMTPDIWRMLFFILLGIVLGNLFERWRFK